MEKLGFEWPDIDEDEVRKGAVLVRNLGTDLEDVIQAVDRKVNGDISGAMRGQTGPATLGAWNTNRSQNLQKLVDIMPPALSKTGVQETPSLTLLKTPPVVVAPTNKRRKWPANLMRAS